MDKKATKKPKRKAQNDYEQRSQAVCVVVYNPEGRPMPDSIANEIVDAACEIAVRDGFLVSFTRT